MGLEEEREVDLVVGLRRGFGRREKVESESEEGIVVSDNLRTTVCAYLWVKLEEVFLWTFLSQSPLTTPLLDK